MSMMEPNETTRKPVLSRRWLLTLAGLGGIGIRTLAFGFRHHIGNPTHAPSHSHLKHFVPKIRTPEVELRKIQEQRDRIRHRLRSKLQRAKLPVARMPNAGSYAKGTSLRRYMYGNTKIGGSDVDLPVVLTARSGDHLDLKALLDEFERLVSESYPRSKVSRTKSSIKLELSSFKYPFDIVPMVAVRDQPNREYLFRADGSRIATSVSEHVKFITSRTRRSADSPGIVRFNDMIRLFKWWRELHGATEQVLKETPTFLLDLLCAKVFDEHGVATSYTHTLQTWFGAMAQIATQRRQVRFDGKGAIGATRWEVLDPVSPDNNVVPLKWGDREVEQLARHFWDGGATIQRIQDCDNEHDGKGALRELQTLFGPAIGNLSLLEDSECV
jgi:hypothetical protein